jgi:AraC-like DNA-binding protein
LAHPTEQPGQAEWADSWDQVNPAAQAEQQIQAEQVSQPDAPFVAAQISDAALLVRSALVYEQKIRDEGCGGICVLHDTASCRSGEHRCAQCDARQAGLCARQYVLKRDFPNMLESDGGDYRNLAGAFLRRLRGDGAFDQTFREKMDAEAHKTTDFETVVKTNLANTDDFNLLYQWRAYTLNEFMDKFPRADRRPCRIEMQILLYAFANYRHDIGIKHVEARFAIPQYAINRYLRRCFQCSYANLLSMIRNEHSKGLLLIPRLRIGEIAALVGYKSNFLYSLNFKRIEGISPKEYRERAGSV